MNLSEDLQIICDALHIPIYVFEAGQPLRSFPEEAGFYPPPALYMPSFTDVIPGPYIPTDFSAMFGFLPLTPDGSRFMLLGPVAQLTFTRSDFHRMFSEYPIRSESQEEFIIFCHGIPHHSPREFGQILAMIHHFLRTDIPMNFEFHAGDQLSESLLSRSVENRYEQTIAEQRNDSLRFESIMVDIVEHGRLERLPGLLAPGFMQFKAGTVAEAPLRNEKDLRIALITVLTRAAIRGGMDDQLAFQLSDQYIQNIEKLTTGQELTDLIFDAIFSFTTQVSNAQTDHIANADMNRIISYVRKHTHEPLTAAGIAETFGYNNSYLSTRFKKELGFGLSSFIYRTRLEEARQLLAYTDRSLTEISDSLCFASQSHFQKKFKDQYGVTPLQYRREAGR